MELSIWRAVGRAVFEMNFSRKNESGMFNQVVIKIKKHLIEALLYVSKRKTRNYFNSLINMRRKGKRV